MFRPRDSHDLRVLATDLKVSPEAIVRMIQDPHSNSVALVQPLTSALELSIVCSFSIEHAHTNNLELPVSGTAEFFPFSYTTDERFRPGDVLAPPSRGPARPTHGMGASVRPHRWTDPHERHAGRDERAHTQPRGLPWPRRRRHPASARHAEARQWHLPRLRAADDGGCAQIGSGRTIRVGLSLRSGTRHRQLGGRSRDTDLHAGRRSTHAWLQAYLPGAAGCPSTRPTTCWAATS